MSDKKELDQNERTDENITLEEQENLEEQETSEEEAAEEEAAEEEESLEEQESLEEEEAIEEQESLEEQETSEEEEATEEQEAAEEQDTLEEQESLEEDGSQKTRGKIGEFLAKHRTWIPFMVITIVVLVGVIVGSVCWIDSRPKFHDLTVELGTENINIEAFMTEFANPKKVGIVTDLSTVDISSVGSVPLTLRNGSKNETVTLTVEDTTFPEVEFILRLEKTPDYQPDPNDFVASSYDLSPTRVRFVGNVVVPLNYEDQIVTVIVEDTSGNSISQECTLSIVWLKREYTLELGEKLSKESVLYNPVRDGYMIGQDEIDVINGSGVGEYTVKSLVDGNVCRVRVVDTVPPELVVTDLSVFQGEEVTAESFVESCFDVSGDVQLRLTTQPDVGNLGIQTMTIEATDINGNTTTATAKLAVVQDKTPPVIRGLSTLSVQKRSNPDYLAGVSAVDEVDGDCEVSCDSRGVDLTAAGTYYVTYTAQDKDGNTAKVKRTVVVEHDQEDTDALADSIAAGLSDDPEEIRDYVRNTIAYSHNSGGNDPTWYGFTNKAGDCLVHAYCLQALLTRKGYETQLIWVTDKTHYWLIINLDGVWRHIDATPSDRHNKISLMTDEQRYAHLQGRNWDRSAWPKCE